MSMDSSSPAHRSSQSPNGNADVMNTLLPSLVLLLGATASIAQETAAPTEDQIAAAIEASNVARGSTTFWRSDELGLTFGYDERWKTANPSQASTAVVVNWTSREAGGLMATCYLEVNDSEVGRLTPEQIRQRAEQIADSILRNGRLRDPGMQMVEWRLAAQDNLPVIYIERDMSVNNISDTIRARIYSVVTAWRGREISFECASSIPVTFPELAGVVESPITRVLSSLQFVRGAQ